MPCNLSEEEVLLYEREFNQERFGTHVTDEQLLKEVACDACSTLQTLKMIEIASPLTRAWWKYHQEEDARKQRDQQKREQEKEDAERREQEKEDAERREYERLRRKFENG